MDEVKILQIKQSVFANNDQQAELLRRELKEKGVFLLNLMSSPGSGKTTTLMRTIEALKAELTIGVMEADIDSDVDARAIASAGVKAIQLHTGWTDWKRAAWSLQSWKTWATWFARRNSIPAQ